MLAFMSRGLEYKSRDVLLRLYKALVRPHFGILCVVLGPIPKEGCAGLGGGPEEVHKNDPRNEGFVI